MFKIEVTGTNRSIKTKSGQEFVSQEAFAHIPGGKYPQRIEVLPPKGQQVYAPGLYSFDADSFYVGQFNKLELALKLKPLKV